MPRPEALFRRDRWKRIVGDTPLLDELAAEHEALSEEEQIAATAHVDEVSDDNLRADLGDRLPAEAVPEPKAEGEPVGDEHTSAQTGDEVVDPVVPPEQTGEKKPRGRQSPAGQ